MVPVPDPALVRQLLNDLQEAEERYLNAMAAYESLFYAAPQPPRDIRPGRPSESESASNKLLAFLNANPLVVYDKDALIAAIEGDKDKIENAIYNLHAARKIDRPTRGKYRAKQISIESLSSHNDEDFEMLNKIVEDEFPNLIR
jgi:hypothetical protein